MTGSVVDCVEIRTTLLAGSVPAGPAVETHVRGCAPCAELLRDDAVLGRTLLHGDALQLSAHPPDSLWSSIDGAISAESGPRAWLRSRRTSVRVLLATAAGAVIVTAGGQSAAAPSAQAVAWLALFSLAGLACLWALVAPHGQPRTPRTREVLVGFALALPLAYALASSSIPETSSSELGFAQQALICFVYGSVLALPFIVVVWTLDRSDRRELVLLTGTAGVAGLVANGALALHCPNTEPLHLAMGHATIGGVLAGIGALVALARRRRAEPKPAQ